ncbi:hypothetical protein PENSPDRAFT_691739 [Peniophora sp. CONT]|nr:hypothetical protein PENSPDRAFT_691739 [Peniophora sp. CONT]
MAIVAVIFLGVAAYQAVSKKIEAKRQLHEQEALAAADAIPVPFLEQSYPITSSEAEAEAETPEPSWSVSRHLSAPSKSVSTRSASRTSVVDGPSSSSPLTSSVCEVTAVRADEPRRHPHRIGRILRRRPRREEPAREDPAVDAPPPSYKEAIASKRRVAVLA